MTTLEKIVSSLPNVDRSIIAGIQLERHFSLVDNSQSATLVVLTDRLLNTEGGNGHDGVDGGAVGCLREAIRSAVEDDGSVGMIDRVVIRQRDANVTLNNF